jgi:hypothetical protein
LKTNQKKISFIVVVIEMASKLIARTVQGKELETTDKYREIKSVSTRWRRDVKYATSRQNTPANLILTIQTRVLKPTKDHINPTMQVGPGNV